MSEAKIEKKRLSFTNWCFVCGEQDPVYQVKYQALPPKLPKPVTLLLCVKCGGFYENGNTQGILLMFALKALRQNNLIPTTTKEEKQ